MNRLVRSSSFVGLFLFSGCGSLALLNGSASDSEICQEGDAQEVEGVPGGFAQSVDTVQEYDLSAMAAQLSSGGLSSEVELSSFTLTAVQGVSDLSFVESTAISVGVDGGSTELVRYDRADGGVVGTSITAAAANDVNLVAVANNGKIALNLHVAGQVPETTWSVKLKPCFKAKVDFALKP